MNNVDFHTKNENYDLSADIEPIYFRCPSCSKLYSSDPSNIYVEEPEYTCSKCSTEFSISLLAALQNTEVVGVAKEKAVSEVIELPQQNSQASTEENLQEICDDHDFEALEKGGVSFNDLVQKNFKNDFEEAWDYVVSCYEDRAVHNDFIDFCKDRGDMDFAIEKYASLVNINANDAIAQSFLQKTQVTSVAKESFKTAKQERFLTKSFYITAGIVLAGILIISIGSLWLQNKNIAGLGIGLIFFTFAAKAFFQPRRNY